MKRGRDNIAKFEDRVSSREVIVFTDGSSRGNPGKGGWAAIIFMPKVDEKGELKILVREIAGREDHTTNNRMEISAAINALKKIGSCFTARKAVLVSAIPPIKVYSDSRYLINGITKWIHGWKKNGWRSSAKQDVLNKDLWEILDAAASGKNVVWLYMAGHAGNYFNDRADALATSFADGKGAPLFTGVLEDYPAEKYFRDFGSGDSKGSGELSKVINIKRSGRAYSYISTVKGDIKIHNTWRDCEDRVRTVSGARFKRADSAGEETFILEQFRSEAGKRTHLKF
ncbi:MAG: hypothetical protein A3G59_02215 [Candidatus Taylorbacteria bacterium RIFCSPLOWO2_12_FULL_47_20]|uniref:Ribonuclease H n=2 Tax=Candidatus Tayloriibacteriota TaxID=1817919 RepID=A0A1G2P819_9BACT|nr:MAG: hypothetical protein A3H68_03710 [Candidatus Taylorbacteria bacterium RIFCSPLOWO2_02_FULL_46_40]OHA44496.1 MAG: hypothetical protein A3G59_02215 [Candidatus Taylorbacteria bacterium RIFCSPLOWO2_12_FULL_47_20]